MCAEGLTFWQATPREADFAVVLADILAYVTLSVAIATLSACSFKKSMYFCSRNQSIIPTMKTKQEIWTSSDNKLTITYTYDGDEVIATLSMCGESYYGYVMRKKCGHPIVFFPKLGLHGKWGIPSLYDVTDDLGGRHQWLFNSDRYRLAVDELTWAIRYDLIITDPINISYKGYSLVKDSDDLFPFVVSEFVELHRADNRFTCRFKSLSAAKAAVTRYLSCLQL